MDKYIRDMQSSFERLLEVAKEAFIKWENYPDLINADDKKELIANLFGGYTEQVIGQIDNVIFNVLGM